MNWEKRIEHLMQERGWNQFDLADASGYKQPHISKILKRDTPPSSKTLKNLANAFGVPVQFLTTGIDRPVQECLIPLLKPEQITRWLEAPETLKDVIEDWLPAGTSCSNSSYAMTVFSHDMCNPGNPVQYPFNAIVMVDPKLPKQAGCRTVCQMPDQRIIFRELQESAGEYYLASMNPAFPLISLGADFNARYLGRVIATLIKEPS